MEPSDRLKRALIDCESFLSIDWSEKIGEGLRSIVYSGTYHSVSVAVKVFNRDARALLDEITPDSAPPELEEVETHGRLGFPSLVRMITPARATRDGRPHLCSVMERLDTTVEEWRESSDSISIFHTWSVIHEVACCLSYMHAQGIVHGDVKPSNVLLTLDPFNVKVSDLSSSCSAASPVPSPCTVQYTSPERLVDQKPSTADDAFALGALCHFLTTGTHPPATPTPTPTPAPVEFIARLTSALMDPDPRTRASVGDAIRVLQSHRVDDVRMSAPTLPLDRLPHKREGPAPTTGWCVDRKDGIKYRDLDMTAESGWDGRIVADLRSKSLFDVPGYTLAGVTIYDSVSRDISFLNAVRALDVQVTTNPEVFAETWRALPDAASRAATYGLYTKVRGSPIEGYPAVSLTDVYHGFPSLRAATASASTVIAPLAKLDQGYYGRGVYVTAEPSYALRYAKVDNGCKHIGGALLASSLVYPVTEVSALTGRPVVAPHDTHFVAVTPVSPDPGCIEFFPASEELVERRTALNQLDPPVYSEFVASQSSQILVRHVLHYRPSSTPAAPLDRLGSMAWMWRVQPCVDIPVPTIYASSATPPPRRLAFICRSLGALSTMDRPRNRPQEPGPGPGQPSASRPASAPVMATLGRLCLLPVSVSSNAPEDASSLLDVHGEVMVSLADTHPKTDNTRFIFIKGAVLRRHAIKAIRKVLAALPITTVCIYGSQFSPDGIKRLGRAVQAAGVQNLAIVRSGLTDTLLAALLAQLTRPGLIGLVLDHNGLTDAAASALYSTFNRTRTLEHLSVGHNPMGEASARYLAALVHNAAGGCGVTVQAGGTRLPGDIIHALKSPPRPAPVWSVN